MRQEIIEEISKQGTTVTTFNLHPRAINAIKWITKAHQITKQKLFEVLINNNSRIIDFFELSKENYKAIPLKQRLSRNSLSLLNSKCKKKSFNRDQYISNALIATYNNMSSQMNEDINATNKALSQLKKLKMNVNRLIESIKVNNHLKNSYYSKCQDIMNICNNMEIKMKEDIENSHTDGVKNK